MELQVAYPPEQIFKEKRNALDPVRNVLPRMGTYYLTHVEYPDQEHPSKWRGKTQGIYAWFQDCPFPAKGHPFPQAIHACGGVKRLWRVWMETLASKELWFPYVGFVLMRRKKKIAVIEKFLKGVDDAGRSILFPFYLNKTRWRESVQEIYLFISRFFMYLGIDGQIAADFAETFSTLLQYDDAYCLRIGDLASETTKERLLADPIKEIERLMDILASREMEGENNLNVSKFRNIAKILKIGFYSRWIRGAFYRALQQMNLENIQLDDLDLFHAMLRDDYLVKGYTTAERVEMYKFFFNTFPPYPPRTVAVPK